jgi:hypothetical protein
MNQRQASSIQAALACLPMDASLARTVTEHIHCGTDAAGHRCG